MLKTRDIPNVEILAVGKWRGTGCPVGGCEFTEGDLDEIAATYAATRENLEPPLKLGHDDNQKLLQGDGYPAAGWMTNVRREGSKLLADLMRVPEKIAALMDVGAYRNRSVELDEIVIDGKKHGVGLTGMALLGADLPAVQSLADITALYSAQKMTAEGRAILFSESAQRMTFADNAEHVLTDVQALIERTGELAALRAKDGRTLSDRHRGRLAELRDGLREAQTNLEAFIAEEPPAEPDYRPLMLARLRAAALREAELAGA